jgi:hypothetical protein
MLQPPSWLRRQVAQDPSRLFIRTVLALTAWHDDLRSRLGEVHVSKFILLKGLLAAGAILSLGVAVAADWSYGGETAGAKNRLSLTIGPTQGDARVIHLQGHLIVNGQWQSLESGTCYLIQEDDDRLIMCGRRAPGVLRGVVYARSETQSTARVTVMKCVYRCSKSTPGTLELWSE